MFFSQAGEFLGRRSIAFYCQVTSTVYRKRTGPPPAPPQVLACGQELYQLFELLWFNRSDKPAIVLQDYLKFARKNHPRIAQKTGFRAGHRHDPPSRTERAAIERSCSARADQHNALKFLKCLPQADAANLKTRTTPSRGKCWNYAGRWGAPNPVRRHV